MAKIIGILKIIRPLNCAIMGFAVIVGTSLVSNVELTINLLLGIITSFTLTGSSMVLNDFFDREIDTINEPSRPIPKGDISPQEALVLTFLLIIIGLISAFNTNLHNFLLAILAMIISITYIVKGKRTGLLGNFLVSATVIIPFIYGGLVVDKLETSTLIFVTLVFFSNTSREVTKGIVDVEGDKTQNINTIAIIYGEKRAAILATIFSILAVSLSPLPWIWGIVNLWFIPFVLLTDVGLIVSAVLLLNDYSRSNAKKIKNISLIWFITGLIAFIIGTS